MEKKYQVFVSSTYQDLIEERDEVMKSLLELDCIPSGMELFPSADDETFEYIKKVIDNCDYFLLIVGGKYGSLHQSGKSFTQMEYEYAIAQNIPTLAFLRGQIEHLPTNKFELDELKRTKLIAFKALIQQKLVRYWNTKGELSAIVSRSIMKLMRDKPRGGWTRVSNLGAQKSLDENRIVELLSDLKNNNDVLLSQLNKQPKKIKIEEEVPERLELEIVALSHSVTQANNYAVVLANEEDNRRLPIVIGGFEAQALAVEMEKMTPNRPLTHRLFYNAITEAGYMIVETSIISLEDGIFIGKIGLSDTYNYIELDSRVADMLVLAIIGSAPIYCNKWVFDSASVDISEEKE